MRRFDAGRSEENVKSFDIEDLCLPGNPWLSLIRSFVGGEGFVDGASQLTERAIQKLAAAQGVPGTVCMPGVPKVLICMRALMEQDSDNLEAIYGSVAELRHCVTLHEHFHAALRLGWPAQSRSIPTFARGATIALEEALAAWMELNYARRNARLCGVITEYVQAGDWPEWPYRGAEARERLFKTGGLGAIKALIRAFGEDPATTATLFDVT